MIHEEICTYEVCKLAKEKEFNEKVYHYYQIINKHYCECQDRIGPYIFSFKLETDDCFNRYNKGSEDVISAPTQSQLQRWLREEKGIMIEITIWLQSDGSWRYRYKIQTKEEVISSLNEYNSYELALEDALKYALENLI